MAANEPPHRLICVTRTPELPHRVRNLFRSSNLTVDFEPHLGRVLDRFDHASYDVLIITSVAITSRSPDGMELLEVVLARSPATQVLFLAESRDLEMAFASLASGAYQYAKLPINDQELTLLVQAALDNCPVHEPRPDKPLKPEIPLENLIGRSSAMQGIIAQMRQAAATDLPVLLTGETGTGKDLAAEAIHKLSARESGPFVPVHLGALPVELVAAELFGHERGAFTGATQASAGRFEDARNGTVFLDEIGTVNQRVQVMLLRVLEKKSFRRLGGRRAIAAGARIIAATNEELDEAVAQGTFRQDLYYRLEAFHITLPPLRERHGDIPALVDWFMKRYNQEFQKSVTGIAPDCIARLMANDWPGNVRELRNVVQRAVLVCQGETILSEHLPPRLQTTRRTRPRISFEVGTPLLEVEREMIIRVLAMTRNNRTEAARLLGISRRALYNKLKRFGV